ncbi:hypothetical protein M3P21_06415 [Ruegeria sp. 2012CJ41-6]|uniref:AAA+ family ATPase n=2 Tax=Ruegeria spongiae TaxID=2942209 RepID=A0ABT0Q026_9RHOB|nr:hypothetical protein [Ruegeria spongiae]MCL6283162.1 hypothetical protein [Ruegeria spongiae]
MRMLLAIALTAGLAAPVSAQEDEGRSLMDLGAELFLDGLRQEMEPTLQSLLGLADDLGPSMLSFFEEMGPAFADMAQEVKDWSVYEAPEILPNGDIIIRRKPELNPDPEPETPEQDAEPNLEGTEI